MPPPEPQPSRLRVAHLNPRQPTQFALTPDAAARAAIAAELDLLDLPRLEFTGRIQAAGSDSWHLTGQMRAKVVQPCVVTLKPVRSTLSEPVERHYTPHTTQPAADEIEMPDDTIEPLGQFIDLAAVMIEALALALPEYPRADGAALPEDGTHPAADDDRQRPFAALGRLLGRDDSD